jgi:hypothetical protein
MPRNTRSLILVQAKLPMEPKLRNQRKKVLLKELAKVQKSLVQATPMSMLVLAAT